MARLQCPSGEGEKPVRNLMKQALCVTLVLVVAAMAGCCLYRTPRPGEVAVPSPVNLLLPRELRISPFIEVTRADDGVHYLKALVEAKDSFDDAAKAFGTFRFELYSFREANADPKGNRIAVWDVAADDARSNLLHWDGITRMYVFKLRWDNPLAEGTPYVLVVTLSSRFSERLTDERTFDGDNQ